MVTGGSGGGRRQKGAKGDKYTVTVTEGEPTLGGEHTDGVLQTCTPETPRTLLADVTPIHFIKINKLERDKKQFQSLVLLKPRVRTVG